MGSAMEYPSSSSIYTGDVFILDCRLSSWRRQRLHTDTRTFRTFSFFFSLFRLRFLFESW